MCVVSSVIQIYIMDTLCDMMKKYLPNKIVLPSLGNHEGVPVNR